MTVQMREPPGPGTDESQWADMLKDTPEWRPAASGAIVVVSPHPDAEVFGAGGFIHAMAAAGRRVTVVSVTDGEAALPHSDKLDLQRRSELKGALRKLCSTHVSVLRLGLPDGRVAQHTNRLHNALLSVLDPDVTWVAPFENDGHPDHEAVGRSCLDLARTHGCTLVRYPMWAWHRFGTGELRNLPWRRFVLDGEARRAKSRALQCFSPPAMPPQFMQYVERPYEAFLL